MSQPVTHLYEFGPFRLDAIKRLLWRDGEILPLKSKDFDLLLALVARSGRVLEKDALIKEVWPESIVEEGNLSVHIFALRRALGETPEEHRYIVTIPGRGYSFVADVREVSHDPIGAPALPPRSSSTTSREQLEPVGGAVPLDSKFYIERPVDAEFQAALARHDSTVLVKGARQVGKTSLLARSLQQAYEGGAKVVLTDFQALNASHLTSAGTLFLNLSKSIAEQLELAVARDQIWDPDLSPSLNFTAFLRREVLGRLKARLVWGMDEVDRLFTCSFGSEVFGLFRSWHNARSLDPRGPWGQLTLAMAYATEAHLFISDLYQSPFNVGTRLVLEDFTLAQVEELNRRYGSPLSDGTEVARYFGLLGGHPYLVRCGLHEMTAHDTSFTALEARADDDEGPFGDHLRRLLIALSRDPALCEVVLGVMQGQGCPSAESFYRLRTAGVIVGDAAQEVNMRCRLYSDYLKKHLL